MSSSTPTDALPTPQEVVHIEQAKGIAAVLTQNYDRCKYEPAFCLRGIVEYWNESTGRLHDTAQENSYGDFVKRSGEVEFLKTMEGSADYTLLEDIVSERKLLSEAADAFLSFESSETLFWEFLLKYDVGSGKLDGSSYRGVFERLYMKHGKRDLPMAVKELLEKDVHCKVKERDGEAGKTTRKIAPELRELYNRIDSKSETGRKLSNARSRLSNAFGKIKVKKTGGGQYSYDWDAFLREAENIRKAELEIDYDAWVRELIFREESDKADKMVAAKGISDTRSHYEVKLDEESNSVQRGIFKDVLRDIELSELFENTPYFNETMMIHTGRVEEE